MSVLRRSHKVSNPRARAGQAAAQVKPLARSTAAAANRSLHATRSWAAPQLERTAHAVEANLAPKVSAALTSAAQRLEPDASPRRRWRTKLAGVSVLTAASAAAAAVLSRRRPDRTSGGQADADEEESAQRLDGQTSTGAEADAGTEVDGRVRS